MRETRVAAERERTIELARSFVEDARRDVERASGLGMELPPRVRSMHNRPGHTTPEFRTVAVPPDGARSPEALSERIGVFARRKPPCRLFLVFEAEAPMTDGAARQLLIAEARDRWGTRLYLIQPFTVADGEVRWEEAVEGGWRDPGEEEMILDASFATAAGVEVQPAPRGAEAARA